MEKTWRQYATEDIGYEDANDWDSIELGEWSWAETCAIRMNATHDDREDVTAEDVLECALLEISRYDMGITESMVRTAYKYAVDNNLDGTFSLI